MLSREGYSMLDKLLSEGLITIGMFNLILEEDGDARNIIRKFIVEKRAIMKAEKSTYLERLVFEAIIAKELYALDGAGEDSMELLSLWRKFLEITEISQDYEVSVVLSHETFGMLIEFLESKMSRRRFTIMNLSVKNIFVGLSQEISEDIWNYLKESFGATMTADPKKFAENAKGIMVICDNVNSEDPDPVELLARLLFEGVFLIINQEMKLRLTDLIAFKEAIDNCPTEDGQAVIYSGGKLFTKPFDPLTIPTDKDPQCGYGCGNEGPSREDVQAMLEHMFS